MTNRALSEMSPDPQSVGRYFKISGVLALISLVFTIIGLFAALPVMLQA